MDLSFHNIFLIIFGAIFTGFAIFWMKTAFDLGAPFPVPLLGLIFVAAGVALIVQAVRGIIKDPVLHEDRGPATYSDYMKAQETAKKKENEDLNTSGLSTEKRR